MFYVCTCPIEPNGSAGVWRCSDGATLVIQSDECEALWEDPAKITLENAFHVDPPNYVLPNRSVPVYGGFAVWAMIRAIQSAIWWHFIVAESTAINEE